MSAERLQKVMARAGVASRRRSEEMILRGLVRVDGSIVRELGTKVDPLACRIEVMGQEIKLGSERTHIMLNKPPGYITTLVDPYNRPTVMELVKEHAGGLFPVGRLDLNSEGLLLLMDDGELSYRLTHPQFKVPKEYVVEVRGCPDNKAVWRLRQGVELDDGMTAPAVIRIRDKQRLLTTLEVTIAEGRKRQIRRMCQAIGHPVERLRRIAVGPLKLGQLPLGDSRPLTSAELALLKQAVGLE